MSCNRVRNSLALFLDDMLDSAEKQTLEEHLTTCAACREELAQLRRDRSLLQALPLVSPPPAFRAELLKKVHAEKPRKRAAWRYFAPRLASLAAVLMVVLLVGNIYLFPMQGPQLARFSENAGGDRGFQIKTIPPEVTDDPSVDSVRGGAHPQESEEPPIPTLQPAERWLWSGLAGLGIFGIGTGYWVYRFRQEY